MSNFETPLTGVLNGRPLSSLYLQPDGSYICEGPDLGPVADGEVKAFQYHLAGIVTGAPTGGGLQAWFEQVMPTSGFGATLPATETNDAAGLLRQRLRGSVAGEAALLPQGDWPEFAVRFDEGTDPTAPRILSRSILNVPHRLVLKGAFTGGTTPDVKLSIVRVPLTQVPGKAHGVPISNSSAVTGSSFAVTTAPGIRRISRIQMREQSGTGTITVQLRDNTGAGALHGEWRLGPNQAAEFIAPDERAEIVLTGNPYYLLSTADAGTVRIITQGRHQ